MLYYGQTGLGDNTELKTVASYVEFLLLWDKMLLLGKPPVYRTVQHWVQGIAVSGEWMPLSSSLIVEFQQDSNLKNQEGKNK